MNRRTDGLTDERANTGYQTDRQTDGTTDRKPDRQADILNYTICTIGSLKKSNRHRK